jgi:fatty acid desaturase
VPLQESQAQQNGRRLPIPGALNIGLSVAAAGASLCLLWCASHVRWWVVDLAAAIAFSYTNNTTFALLHESVHGLFHPSKPVNEWFGRFNAALFPTALLFQRTCHLGHHRRNRTDAELFDYYKPGDNRFLKFAQWYGILTGVYWVLMPLACLLYLLCPWAFRLPALRREDSRLARQTGADAMLEGFENAPTARIRGEILLTLLIQAAVVYSLHLTLAGWLLCYGCFAVNWSSLQYADHAWSVLDVYDGAWNLRVNPVIQYIFLNYHHHLAHHRNPNIPWLHLPKHVELSGKRPSFLGIYLKMWMGPRPYSATALDEAGKRLA